MNDMKIKGIFEKGEYPKYVTKKMPKSNLFLGMLRAFVIGGGFCMLGEALREFAKNILLLNEEGVSAFASVVLIAIGAFLTSFGVYDVIGKFAGAGSIVPITGFANSIVAPAMEYKNEGFVLGVGAKMFTVAGPVLVYGISASFFAGIIIYLTA